MTETEPLCLSFHLLRLRVIRAGVGRSRSLSLPEPGDTQGTEAREGHRDEASGDSGVSWMPKGQFTVLRVCWSSSQS